MDEPFDKQVTFEAVAATYGTAQQVSTGCARGTIERISGYRSGSGTGTVSVQVYEDAALARLVCEVDLDLSGDADVDVAAPLLPIPWHAAGGPYLRAKDTAAAGDDITLTIEGVRRHGA